MSNEWNGEENPEIRENTGIENQTGFVLVDPVAESEKASQEEAKTQPEEPLVQQNATCEHPQQINQSGGYQFWEQKSNTQNQHEQQTQNQYIQNEQNKYNDNQQRTAGAEPKPPKKKSFGMKLAVIAASAAVFGIVAGVCFQGVGYVNRLLIEEQAVLRTEIGGSSNGTIDRTTPIPSTSIIRGSTSEGDVSAIVENAMPSIVSISSTVSQPYQDFFGNTYDNEVSGSGSGIIIGKNDKELLIATNNHVVAGAKKIKVTCINNDVLIATIKGSDASADLAVVAVDLSDIKPETMKDIKIAALGDSDVIKVGEKVLAIGNALGYGQSLTVGYISAKNREVRVDDNKMVLLQTDAAINPGNSGGALINMRGEVIGINSVKYAADAVEGMGYAIPISAATPIINELMNKETVKAGDEGYLGIMGRDVPEEVSTMYNMPMGAFVAEVTEGGGAEKAGILSGDIITAVNGIETKSMDSVKEKVNGYPAGTVVTVTIQRRNNSEYVPQDIKVTLQKQPKVSSSEKQPKSKEEDNTITIPFGYDYAP